MTVQTERLSPNSDTEDNKGSSFLNRRKENERLKGLASFVTDEYTRCKSARVSVERIWYKNLSFYLGNQWVVYLNEQLQNGTGKLITPKAPPWRTRLTVNRIKPIIRTELARVTSQKPNASVVPASSEDEDLFAAQAGEQVWEAVYSDKKIFRTFSRTAWWMLICGVGFTKIYWDESKTDKISNTTGDFCIENVTPFHIFVPDLTIEEIDDQQYVIHAYTKPVGVAKQMFPDFADKLQANVSSTNDVMDDVQLKIANNNKPDSVLCVEMWLKPGVHKDFPEGGMVQVVGGYVVQEVKGNPYNHQEFPFTKFEHIPTGKFYTDSVIVDLISLQREYNRTRSQIIEAKNRMAKPQLRAPKGSVEVSKITSEPGVVIEYNPGFNPPEPMPLQPIPGYVMEELNRIVLDMEDISAQHQVSKGNVPTGVTAATAISYLQERDDSVLTHTYNSVEQGFERIAKQILTLAVQYWDVPRVVKVTGTDGAFDALALKGSDLKSGTDIRMEAGSSLPVSKAARQAFIMDMMKMGFIPPDQGLRIMEIGGVQKLYDQLQVDERQAQRENLRMKALTPEQIAQSNQMHNMWQMQVQQMQTQAAVVPPELSDVMGAPGDPSQMNMPGAAGMAAPDDNPDAIDTQTGMPLEPPDLVPVNSWDNHAVHIEVHNRFRKSQGFEMLSDDHKELFELHVSKHAMALNQSAQNAQGMEQMGAMPGGDGQTPPPSSGGGQQMPPPPGMEGMQ